MNLKKESELGDHLFTDKYTFTDNTWKLHVNCTPVLLEVRGISHGTLLPLTLKTNLNKNLARIFNWTLKVGSLSFVIN